MKSYCAARSAGRPSSQPVGCSGRASCRSDLLATLFIHPLVRRPSWNEMKQKPAYEGLYLGGPFPVPLTRQSRVSLPLPRVSRAGFAKADRSYTRPFLIIASSF